MDPALKSLLEECKGDQGMQRKIQTWSKPGGVFSMYLKHCIPLRLSDEQMVERDASILRQRVENRKKIDAKWQEVVDMKDAQIQVIKEGRDRGVGMYKDLHESSFASVRGYEGRDKRWNAFIQNRMDFLEKFEEVHEQQLAELDDARSKLSVEVVSREVVKDAMAFLNKKRKRKSKWGGDRKSTKFRAMEFATNDCKGATSIEDTFIRVSTMVSMTSCAAKDTRKLDKAHKFYAALSKLRSSASVVS